MLKQLWHWNKHDSALNAIGSQQTRSLAYALSEQHDKGFQQ